MFRKTMIVLAKAAALTSGMTVEAFAHGGGRGHGGGGHVGGFGGARIGSGFGSGFAGHILARRLGWRCLVSFSRPSPQSRRRRWPRPQSLHARRVDSMCEIHSRSRANRQLSHG
jgi:hypothetical protein